jgi:hypothetical protein
VVTQKGVKTMFGLSDFILSEKVSMKKMDKEMQALIRSMEKKEVLVVKRNKAGEKKSFAAGKFAAGGGAEHMWSSVLNYLAAIFIFGGKNKAKTKQMLEQNFPDVDADLIMEQIEIMVDEAQNPLMEMNEVDTRIILDFEPVLMKMQRLVEEWGTPDCGRLSVAALNEEVHQIQKKKKVVSSVKEMTPKEKKKQQLKRFYHLYDVFKNKLAEHNVIDPDRVRQFLEIMISKVANISIKSGKEKGNGK